MSSPLQERLPAMAVGRAILMWLTHRVRQQAGSYRGECIYGKHATRGICCRQRIDRGHNPL
jgi:hypothetical protein